MKAIKQDVDRVSIYLIEAARFSYLMMRESFSDLQKCLSELEGNTESFGDVVSVNRLAWQFIDMGYRFGRVLAQIRGLKHKDKRYKSVEQALSEIIKARNYIQHLNTRIPKISADTYPILGAISWPSENRQKSNTISIGTLPPGTSFHSLSFDSERGEFIGGVMLNINSFSINLSECLSQLKDGNNYLSEWLEENDLLSDQNVVPNKLVVPALKNTGLETMRFLRVKINVNEGTDKSSH